MLHTFGFLKFSDEHNVYFKLDSIGICGYTIFKNKAYKLVLVLTVSLELGVPTQKTVVLEQLFIDMIDDQRLTTTYNITYIHNLHPSIISTIGNQSMHKASPP